jgi:hypothetical protein
MASVDGTFSFITPTDAPGLGISSHRVIFTALDSAEYHSVSGLVRVTVDKATPVVTCWPSASAITFGQTLAACTLSGGTASVAGNFHFTTPEIFPRAGVADQEVTFIPADTTNRNCVSSSIKVPVEKARTSLTLDSSPNPSIYGGIVTFTVTVIPAGAHGTIVLENDADYFRTVLITNGAVRFETTDLGVGEHRITAQYEGNDDYATSTSEPLQQRVDPLTIAVNKSPAIVHGEFTVGFAGTPGYTFTIEGTDTLGDANSWRKKANITAPPAAQGAASSAFEFHEPMVGTPCRFYRAVYPAY